MRFSLSTNPFSAGGLFARESVGCRFKGGGSSESSASTTNTTNTDASQTDNRIATSGQTSIVASGGSDIGSVTIESQDAETTRLAIEGAGYALKSNEAVSIEALKSAVDLGKYSFDSARDLGKAALDTSRATQKDTLDFTDSAIQKASNAFAAAQGADTSKLQDTLTKIALGALLVGGAVGVAYFATKSRK